MHIKIFARPYARGQRGLGARHCLNFLIFKIIGILMIVLYIHGHEYIAYIRIHGHEYTSNIQFVYCNLLYIMEVHNIPGILRSRHLQNAINIS